MVVMSGLTRKNFGVFLVFLGFLAPFAAFSKTGNYKILAKAGYGAFSYTVPFHSATRASPALGLAVDLGIGQVSSLGVDLLIGFDLKKMPFSQFHILYKYYPLTYNSFVINGDADTKVSLSSRWYPYVTGGVGYSTLIVSVKASSSSTVTVDLISQYFDVCIGAGTDFSIAPNWGVNFQSLVSYGQGSAYNGSMRAVGFTGQLGSFLAF